MAAGKRALVFGAGGQAGSYLCELLLTKGYEVHASVRGGQPAIAGAHIYTADIRDADSVDRAVCAARPDEVYNFASLMFAPASWAGPGEYIAVNAGGAANVLAAVDRHFKSARVFQAGSADVFDLRERRIDEDSPRRPTTPYGVSKLAAEELVRSYRKGRGLFACCGIFFNMESPRRPATFFAEKVAAGVARIRRDLDAGRTPEPLKFAGGLSAVRDWGLAREYVEAACRMLQNGTPDDYVVATGESHSCRRFVERAFVEVGIASPECWKHVEVRDGGEPQTSVCADPSRIHSALGWRATSGFDAVVAELVSAAVALGDHGAASV